MLAARRRVHEILRCTTPGDTAGRAVDWFILALIAVNTFSIVLQTVPSINERWGAALEVLDWVIVTFFILEYAARLWSSAEVRGDLSPLSARLRWMRTPLALIDLIAILPTFVPLLSGSLSILRLARVFRLLRLLKIGRYSKALQRTVWVLRHRKEELAVALIGVLILLTLTSSLMYVVEHETQPDAFASIPAAMWWSMAALTTVGYGDVYPVTTLGRILGGAASLLGLGLFALPAGILASGFSAAVEAEQNGGPMCPTCGGPLPDDVIED
ncbi:MAG: ion transporter [Coriobacteriia bacterium]|nr:ion transporter [Coriobacteriia bacterium]